MILIRQLLYNQRKDPSSKLKEGLLKKFNE